MTASARPEAQPTAHFTAHPEARPTAPASEHRKTFDCFGSQCTVIAADAARPADAAAAVAIAKRALLGWHRRFSRFDPASELTQINRDPSPVVQVTPLMRRVIEAALDGARDTDGLVDPALGVAIERAGYDSHMEGDGIPLSLALSLAPQRRPATGDPAPGWHSIPGVSPRACSPTNSPRCCQALMRSRWTAAATYDWAEPHKSPARSVSRAHLTTPR